MFLHIGNDNIINKKDVIGFFNIRGINKNTENEKILENLNKNNLLKNNVNTEEKTLILTEEEKQIKGYLSNISSVTLAKRARNSVL